MVEFEAVVRAMRDFVVPLLTIDEATVYVVEASPSRVHLHLGGAYSGCAGRSYVERGLLAPVVASVLPRATLTVTSGMPLPASAVLVTADDGGRRSPSADPLGARVL